MARVSVWVGEIQWIKKHGFTVPANPVLRKLKNIVCHDALINPDGSEYHWPHVNVIVGNPPFIGDKKMLGELGEEYTNKVRSTYKGRVPNGADFVCFWFEKAFCYMRDASLERAGLVSTNSIRGGKNRQVLDKISEEFHIYDAWPDEEWVNEGASVRVSMTSFSALKPAVNKIRNIPVFSINTDLTAREDNESFSPKNIRKLEANKDIAFIGTQKSGAFDIGGDLAREWLQAPLNPNGQNNAQIVKPWINGIDLTRRPQDKWIIDFPDHMSELDAALFELPFEYILKNVKEVLETKIDLWTQEGKSTQHIEKQYSTWWIQWCYRAEMRNSIKHLTRYIATARNGKHRVFTWQHKSVVPDCQVVAIARDDDTSFGIISSKFHRIWSLKLCSWLGKGNDPRYTPSTTFETFPFPKGLEPSCNPTDYMTNDPARKIADAAKKLNELRQNWLNPADLVELTPEVYKGFPDRVLPINKEAANLLKKRTLTNLYNENPVWLQNAHRELDQAVSEAYGWPIDLTENEILEELFILNQGYASTR